MATTQDTIRLWLVRGQAQQATHMLVVCDTYDWEDYPVFVKEGQDVRKVVNAHTSMNMTKVMEVYSFKQDLELQLLEHRAMNYD